MHQGDDPFVAGIDTPSAPRTFCLVNFDGFHKRHGSSSFLLFSTLIPKLGEVKPGKNHRAREFYRRVRAFRTLWYQKKLLFGMRFCVA